MSNNTGYNYIGGHRSAAGTVVLRSVDATTGEALPPHFRQATPEEVDAAAIADRILDAAIAKGLAKREDLVEVPGPHHSIMAGLNCGLASMLALPTMTAGFDAFVTIGDDRCGASITALADAGLDVGECGAAGVAALAELSATHSAAWPLPADATALVIATEGVTDPAGFERWVGRAPNIA